MTLLSDIFFSHFANNECDEIKLMIDDATTSSELERLGVGIIKQKGYYYLCLVNNAVTVDISTYLPDIVQFITVESVDENDSVITDLIVELLRADKAGTITLSDTDRTNIENVLNTKTYKFPVYQYQVTDVLAEIGNALVDGTFSDELKEKAYNIFENIFIPQIAHFIYRLDKEDMISILQSIIKFYIAYYPSSPNLPVLKDMLQLLT